jgi:hypothetical protein
MTTLFDATKPVKTTRPFGHGILAARPVYTSPVSHDDRLWWAAENARIEARNADLERRAGASAAVDRMSRGQSAC